MTDNLNITRHDSQSHISFKSMNRMVRTTIQAMIVAMLRGGKAIGLSIAAASTSAFSALASFVIGQIGTRFGIFYGVLVILLFNVLALTIALALSMMKNREHF